MFCHYTTTLAIKFFFFFSGVNDLENPSPPYISSLMSFSRRKGRQMSVTLNKAARAK
jgi:hypothetical protein